MTGLNLRPIHNRDRRARILLLQFIITAVLAVATLVVGMALVLR